MREKHTWSVVHCFGEDTGITLTDRRMEKSKHFKDARGILKHLRALYPHRVFKSEVWHYYGKNWCIKVRDY